MHKLIQKTIPGRVTVIPGNATRVSTTMVSVHFPHCRVLFLFDQLSYIQSYLFCILTMYRKLVVTARHAAVHEDSILILY